MIRLPKWSLRYKFIVPLALFTIVLALAISYISVERFYIELENQLADRGKDLGKQLVDRFWRNVGVLLPPDTKLHYYQVVQEGTQIYSSVVNNAPPWTEETLSPPVDDSRQLVQLNGKPYLELILATDPGLVKDPTTANYVRLYLSMADVYTAVQRAFLTISIFTIIFILAGIGIAIWLYRSILGPIEVLTKSVKRFKIDLKVRAVVKTGDELQTLAEEFNGMANTIQERDERLERINVDLTKANQVKSEFLAVMGHELKTPLHAIRGYSQLMLEGIEGPVTPTQKEDLENIVQSSDHLRSLIDNILQFSKLESGQEMIHPESVEVSKIVEEAMKHVSVLAREKGIAVHASANGIRVYADETKLKQVLINLLSNALKYTKTGEVEVSTKKRRDEVLFAIKDTGIGIPEEMYEKIFEPFTQLDSSNTREWGGIGLGLSIVKKYVEMHGGKIWLESQVGKGTTFYFTIPLEAITNRW
ncbi:HAMP domain-containing histidine kinase [Candidatus Acetothermia bacterium]|nr:HAMP domain-containing histidine kinase [Candidatus Acetothermia bacterium]MBI3642581.1 HAMP domain-containing histidine kinase [Candidatus Acetothermia bacterium]